MPHINKLWLHVALILVKSGMLLSTIVRQWDLGEWSLKVKSHGTVNFIHIIRQFML